MARPVTSLVLICGKVVRVAEPPEKVAELLGASAGSLVRLQGVNGPVWVNPASVATMTEADRGRP
jgi:hypothetical protein